MGHHAGCGFSERSKHVAFRGFPWASKLLSACSCFQIPPDREEAVSEGTCQLLSLVMGKLFQHNFAA